MDLGKKVTRNGCIIQYFYGGRIIGKDHIYKTAEKTHQKYFEGKTVL
jgi:hypothetical protein